MILSFLQISSYIISFFSTDPLNQSSSSRFYLYKFFSSNDALSPWISTFMKPVLTTSRSGSPYENSLLISRPKCLTVCRTNLLWHSLKEGRESVSQEDFAERGWAGGWTCQGGRWWEGRQNTWTFYSLRGHHKALASYLEIFETDLGFKRIVLLPRIKAWRVDRRWQP